MESIFYVFVGLMAKILAVWSGRVAPGPVCRGMYVLVTEMEIYMEFGIEMPVGWYLVYRPILGFGVAGMLDYLESRDQD
jgi:hypothetical protein